MITTYKGTEITKEILDKVLSIAKSKYDERIYDEYYGNVINVSDLAYVHGIDVSDEAIILGEDWYFEYADLDDTVAILEWVSTKSERSNLIKGLEMKKHLLKFFMDNSDKMFEAEMRHDSSYKFYQLMVEKGIFEEFFQETMLDVSTPTNFIKVINENYSGDINSFLNSEDAIKYKDYYKFIMHSLIFTCTNNFKIGENPEDNFTPSI